MTDLVRALRDYATWTRHAQERGPGDPLSISIDDMDADMLDEAADALARLPCITAELRHLYENLYLREDLRRLADGLLAPQIRHLEKLTS